MEIEYIGNWETNKDMEEEFNKVKSLLHKNGYLTKDNTDCKIQVFRKVK